MELINIFGVDVHWAITAKLNYCCWLLDKDCYYGGPFGKDKYRTKLSCANREFDFRTNKFFPIFKNKKAMLRYEIKRVDEYYNKLISRLHDYPTGDSRDMLMHFIKEAVEKKESLEKKLYFISHPIKFDDKNSIDWEAVRREYPIGDIMPTKPVAISNNRQMYLCPIHNEKTGSFVWYKNNNSWHCFGCGAGSSNIDLVMALNGCDALEAAKILIHS